MPRQPQIFGGKPIQVTRWLPLEIQIEAQIAYCPVSGCWFWAGKVDTKGYGTVSIDRQWHRAHRLVYTLRRGTIPDGLTLDHLCRQRLCVNPDHLEPVTLAENTRRGTITKTEKPHCRFGHSDWLVTEDRRRCRVCHEKYHRQYEQMRMARRHARRLQSQAS